MKKSSQAIFSITIAVIFLIGYPSEALAEGSWIQSFLAHIGFRRDIEGKVGSRPKGGGGRGNCPNLAYLNKAKDLQLIAIIPEAQPYSSPSLTTKTAKIIWSYSIQQRPNLWFYIPYKSDEGTQVKFAKLALIDEKKHLVTQAPFLFELPQQPGIVQVKLPIDLEVNKPYQWFFSVVCDDNKPSRNPSVSGWIQRVSPNQAGFILQPSEDMFSRINYRDIVSYGLWFDAFTQLAEVYQLANPQNNIQSSVNFENFTKTKSLDNEIQEDWLAVFKGLQLDDENIISEISQSPIFKLNCVSKTDGSKCE